MCPERPGWTTLHPDNWTVLEVAEWLNSVAEEYSLSYEVKVSLASAFSGVNGRQLMAMTLQNFTDLDPRHGGLLFTVFRHTVCAGETIVVWSWSRNLYKIIENERQNKRKNESMNELKKDFCKGRKNLLILDYVTE